MQQMPYYTELTLIRTRIVMILPLEGQKLYMSFRVIVVCTFLCFEQLRDILPDIVEKEAHTRVH